MDYHVDLNKTLRKYDAICTEGDVSRLREIVRSLTDISEFERWWNLDPERRQNPDGYLQRCLREANARVRTCRSAAVWEGEGNDYLARVRENLLTYTRSGRSPVDFLRPRELLKLLDLRHEIKAGRVNGLNVARYELVSKCIMDLISEASPARGPPVT